VRLQAIKQHINEDLSTLPGGIAFSFSPPAIPGVGTSGGFTFILEASLLPACSKPKRNSESPAPINFQV
jgi:hypothetical protein